MGKASVGAQKKEGGEFQLLLAASLISRYERISQEEVYEKASRCFDSLLDVRESPEAARRLALLIDRGISSVQHSAGAIIDLLLFNKKYDPYISLGLPSFVHKSEVSRRWRRLIVLYHPDKYPERKDYEEKAKKINEAYDEIRKSSENTFSSRPVNNANAMNLPRTDAVHYTKYLKYIPTFILALAIFIAIISLLLFMNARKGARRSPKKNPPYAENQAAAGQLPSLLIRDECSSCMKEEGEPLS